MDIWRWVVDYANTLARDGNIRLAQLLLELPEATCDDRHAEVDALVPEALALVRAQKNPWAEVYVRHWYLQSKVLHRHQVAECLPEAVSLLEFANRADTRECPQSVCVTQDLACTYGDIDGPGYADERLAVARETLERIDPTWPCFDCIAGEYAAALMDAGEVEATIEYIELQRKALAAHEIFELGGNLRRRLAMALLESDQPEQALAQLEAWDARDEGGYRLLSKNTLTARALLRLGRVDEAEKAWPAAKDVLPTPGLYEEWLQALDELVAAGVIPNAWHVGSIVRHMQRTLDNNGALYLAAWSATLGARLALARKARAVTRMFLDAARARLDELRRPERLAATMADIERGLAELAGPGSQPTGSRASHQSVDALLERCGDDPERDLDILEPVVARAGSADQGERDGAVRLLLQYSDALRALGWSERAEALLCEHIARHPERATTAQVLEAVGASLLQASRPRDLLALLDRLDPAEPARLPRALRLSATWLRARALRARGDVRGCRKALAALLADAQGDAGDALHRDRAALLLATLERERGAFREALVLLEPLVADDREPGAQDWDRMVVAALLGEWDAVRHSARRLGMGMVDAGPATGPMDVPGELCLIRVPMPSGKPATYAAQRNSPVTARIIQIVGPGELAPDGAPHEGVRERYGDVVVFEPTPLDHDSERNLTTFALIATLEPGNFSSFAIDGVHPGEDAWDRLAARIDELGGAVQVCSSDEYELRRGDQPLPGIYAYVAVPAGLPRDDVHRSLRDLTADWEHPITWLDLARDLGDPDELARQRDIAERYGL